MIGLIIVFSLLTALFGYLTVESILCHSAVKQANHRLRTYPTQTADLSYGKMTFIDSGKGEPILVSHGIFGGYDQGYNTLKSFADDYRLICPSRFGYPGSDNPDDVSPHAQAKAFVELLDQLGIEKTFILGTSAGATIAIRFALDFPERTKGLILISPAAPLVEKPSKVAAYVGPPKMFLNNFAMWLIRPLFPSMMGLKSDSVRALLPVETRRNGIVNDSAINNLDMARNYDNYKIEQLQPATIIFQAKDDKMADFQKTEASAKRFPDCTFVPFVSGGHMLEGNDISDLLATFVSKYTVE